MSTNITDALIDRIITAIEDHHKTYFDDMAGAGFDLKALKQIKKGQPNPVKWYNPSVFVVPERTTLEGPVHKITVNVLYLLKGNDAETLAKSIARGADALAQLIDDKFSITRLEYEFDYGLSDGTQEAAAQISAEIVI